MSGDCFSRLRGLAMTTQHLEPGTYPLAIIRLIGFTKTIIKAQAAST